MTIVRELIAKLSLTGGDEYRQGITSAASLTKTATQEIKQGLGDVSDQTKTTGESMTGLGQVTHSASLMFTELQSGVMLAKEAVGMLAGVYDQVIGKTVAWGQTVEDLSRVSGESAESASRMAIVFGDFGVDVNSLGAAVRAMTKNDLQFNMETIKQLAVEYQAIEDPVARDAFVFKMFGRAGSDLNEILSQTPAQLEALAKTADHSNKVLSEQGLKALEDYRVKTEQLKTDWDGLIVSFGVPTTAGLSSAITGFENTIKVVEALDIVTEERAGLITHEQAVARADALAQGDLLAAYHNVTPAAVSLGDATRTSAAMAANFAGSLGDLGVEVTLITPELVAQNLAIRESAAANDAATIKTYAAAQAIRDKTQALADQVITHEVQAGVQGQVAKNEQAYQQVLDGNADKIATLREEITRLSAAQGTEFTTTIQGTVSQEDYNLAVERAALALDKYVNHGKVSAQSLEGLRIAAEAAQNQVDKLAGKMGSSSSDTADYTTKIAEDQAALDALTLANGRAEDAMHKANREMVLQEASAGLTGKALLDFSLAMGMIDKPSYDAAVSIQAANDQFQKDKDVGRYESAIRLVIDAVNGVKPAADPVPEILRPASEAFAAQAKAAALARESLYNFDQMQSQLHDRTVNTRLIITTERLDILAAIKDTTYTPPTRAAGGPVWPGGAYLVGERGPEIFTPAQSGTITPNGGGLTIGQVTINAAPGDSGEQLVNKFSSALAARVRSAHQGGLGILGRQ